MIPLNTEHRLSPAVFWYSATPSIVAGFVVVVVGAFLKDFVSTSCATQVCPSFAPAIMPTLVLAFIIAVLAHPILNFLLFSYVVGERSVTINSGILYRQYETIDFNRIQTLDLERGPILWLFGLTEVRLWTASADQFNDNEAHVHARPDTTLLLPRDAAQQLKEIIANSKHAAPVAA